MTRYKISIVGAGIYGCSIAIKLAEMGHRVTIYDPLGVLKAASGINQLRVHSGYHYPRSQETIAEVIECRSAFLNEFSEAIVKDTENYYAIPWEGSLTGPEQFEKTMLECQLNLQSCEPDWINFDFIAKCYKVNEQIYDPHALENILKLKMLKADVHFIRDLFTDDMRMNYDFTVFATYGASGSKLHLFNKTKTQVAEKIKVKLPKALQKTSLVVIDGPFTAFDPYGHSIFSQFGSAKYTNHWSSSDLNAKIPNEYKNMLNTAEFFKYENTNFLKMRCEAAKVVPKCSDATYIGSKFTKRLVEDSSSDDRRLLRIEKSDDQTFHVFSGKVVAALKAANIIHTEINNA